MRAQRSVPAPSTSVAVSLTALISAAALLGVLAPEAGAVTPAAPSALRSPVSAAPHNPSPLPLPLAGAETLITEGVTVEGPLLQNIVLPSLTPLL
ncbi:hypothetical protein AB0D49_12230 [Streptomyces sp. NPDC048290]|uniref:hypothetical protein n=1 Tax=Streptomyces sp. NPDC048290 TaxID=3155811 RepID=UPI0034208E31